MPYFYKRLGKHFANLKKLPQASHTYYAPESRYCLLYFNGKPITITDLTVYSFVIGTSIFENIGIRIFVSTILKL